MNQTGDQAVDLVQGQHHGADHHRVFQLLFGHGGVEALALAQADHWLDIAFADQVRIKNLQAFGQADALGAGHGLNVVGLGQQHTTGDAAGLADGGGLHGHRLGAFRQDNALVGLLGTLDQLIAEHGWRQAQLARGTAALVQPVGIQVAGDEVGNDFRAFAVIHRNFLVQLVQLVSRVVGTGAHRQDRQTGQQRPLAQFENARVRLAVAGQQ
ncbi:hypothetical protein D3C72_1612190 [compost metagenome]